MKVKSVCVYSAMFAIMFLIGAFLLLVDDGYSVRRAAGLCLVSSPIIGGAVLMACLAGKLGDSSGL